MSSNHFSSKIETDNLAPGNNKTNFYQIHCAAKCYEHEHAQILQKCYQCMCPAQETLNISCSQMKQFCFCCLAHLIDLSALNAKHVSMPKDDSRPFTWNAEESQIFLINCFCIRFWISKKVFRLPILFWMCVEIFRITNLQLELEMSYFKSTLATHDEIRIGRGHEISFKAKPKVCVL